MTAVSKHAFVSPESAKIQSVFNIEYRGNVEVQQTLAIEMEYIFAWLSTCIWHQVISIRFPTLIERNVESKQNTNTKHSY